MGTIQRGKVNRADLALWDGTTKTYSRPDATSGTVTELTVGEEVDVLQVFGAGTSRTRATIANATQRIGSSNVMLLFSSGTWTIDDDLTIGSNFICIIPAGCVFSVASGKTMTFATAPSIPHTHQIFSGAGSVAFSNPQIVLPDWWDRTSTTCIQKAIDATAQGSAIHLIGKTTTGIEINSDEANQTGDIGKSIVGIGGPGLRLNDVSSGSWGAEIYLAASSDDDVIDINGTDQGGNDGSRFALILRNLKINGNKANQGSGAWNGIRIDHAKDIWLENIYIEDCKQDGVNGSNGSSNQVRFESIEVYNCDRDGLNLGSLADFSANVIKSATNGRYGVTLSAGNAHIDHIHAYLNTDDGLRHTSTTGAIITIDHVRASFNGEMGIRCSGSDLSVRYAELEHNGTTTGETNAKRVGLRLTGTSANNTFGEVYGFDGEGTATQTYHIYAETTGLGNRIGNYRGDGNATVGEIYIDAAARNGVHMGVHRTQESSTASGNQELNPHLGDLVMDTALSGALDFDLTVRTTVPNGHRQRVTLEDGGGQNITVGTNVYEIATKPTPATNAKSNIMIFEYYNGDAFLVEAYQEA